MSKGKLAGGVASTPRSVMSVVAGLALIFALSYGTDYLLGALNVFEPNEPLPVYGSVGLIAFILAYRVVFSVAGAYLTARLSPRRPMKHAMIIGIIGVVISTSGAIVGMQQDLGPSWYLWGLVALALPAAWLGGKLSERKVI